MKLKAPLFVFLLLSACSLTSPPVRTPAPSQNKTTPKPGSAPQLPRPPATPQQTPEEPASDEPEYVPERKEYTLGSASRALVTQAQGQVGKRDFAVAAATVERALRIEPQNPVLWLELGKVRQAAGNYAQADSTARKALSLASGDLKLQSNAWNLIAASLRARGKHPDAADAAARAAALMPD